MPVKLEPRKGAIALCTVGNIGLITSAEPQEVVYPDGTKGNAWVGVQLADRTFIWHFGPKKDQEDSVKAGDPWSSKKPKVICYVEDLLLFSKNAEVFRELANDLNINADQDLQWFKNKLYRGFVVPSTVVKAKTGSSVEALKMLCEEYEHACLLAEIDPIGSEAYNNARRIILERTGGKNEREQS